MNKLDIQLNIQKTSFSHVALVFLD